MVRLGPWAPDQVDFLNPGLERALNILPTEGGYGPVRGLQAIETALDGPARGAIAVLDSNGTPFIYAGDSTKLYVRTSNGFSDVSRPAGYSGNNQWIFEQFGDRIIAANGSNPVQFIELGASNFADLPNAPATSYVSTVRNFLFAVTSEGVRWSGRDNSENWTAGDNGSDSQPLPEGGRVLAITGGAVGYIFQDSAITRASFTGGATIFRFDTVEPRRGALAAGGVVQAGRLVYFLSPSGVEVFDGNRVTDIGININATILSQIDQTQPEAIFGAYDRQNRRIMWTYRTPTGSPRQLHLFLDDGRFTESDLDLQTIFADRSLGQSLDDITDNIDTFPVSLDSETLRGGVEDFNAFNASNQLAAFSGPPLTAQIRTGEYGGETKVRTRAVRVHTDGEYTVQMRSRDRTSAPQRLTGQISPNRRDECRFRENARYRQIDITVDNFSFVKSFTTRESAGGL